jgi:Tetratricopeptide repeat
MSRFLVSAFVLLLSAAAPAQDQTAAAAMQKGQAAVQEGDFDTGIAAFRKATELDPANGRAWQLLGYCLHLTGKLDEALPVHQKAATFPEVAGVASYNVACVYSLKGDKDKAFEWLGKAVAAGFADRTQLVNDTDFEALRSDPRFEKIASKLESGVQVYAPMVERRCSRLAFFADRKSPGQIALNYSSLEWQDRFEETLESPKFVGKKWRLGREFWTTLDNSMPLQVAGVDIPAGYWYLTLEHRGDKKFVLGVHEPAEARRLQLDPFRADLLTAGIEIPLQHRASKEAHQQLDIRLVMPMGEHTDGELQIGFGGHELVADLHVDLAGGASK